MRVFDNSEERDVESGQIPQPRLFLRWERGVVIAPTLSAIESTAEWAKPIVACALQLKSRQVSDPQQDA